MILSDTSRNKTKFSFFEKVFCCRRGTNCAYILFVVPFVRHTYYTGRKYRQVFLLTKNMRPIIKNEYDIWSLFKYLEGCSHLFKHIDNREKIIQRVSHLSLMCTFFEVIKFSPDDYWSFSARVSNGNSRLNKKNY